MLLWVTWRSRAPGVQWRSGRPPCAWQDPGGGTAVRARTLSAPYAKAYATARLAKDGSRRRIWLSVPYATDAVKEVLQRGKSCGLAILALGSRRGRDQSRQELLRLLVDGVDAAAD